MAEGKEKEVSSRLIPGLAGHISGPLEWGCRQIQRAKDGLGNTGPKVRLVPAWPLELNSEPVFSEPKQCCHRAESSEPAALV